MFRKILAILLVLSLCAGFSVPVLAAEEDELPLEVQLNVHSDRKRNFKMDGLYLDNVLYIHPHTVCELTGAFIHEDQGDSITFSLHSQGRLITVTPNEGGRLNETCTMFNTYSYNYSIPCIFYDGDIYTSATHLLRYMGAVVGFGKDHTADTHMTVQMNYTTMDLVADFAETDGYWFDWDEAQCTFLQAEDVIGLAALDTILLGYDSNILAYAAPGHADKVGEDYYTDLLKEILRAEGAELTQSGYSEVDMFGDASNVTGFSANWIKEVLGWIDDPKLLSNVNGAMSGALDGAGLLLNVGGDYLKTLDTAAQFANMTYHQQILLDQTLNLLSQENAYRKQLPQLFAASEKVSSMISGEYNANEAAAWNSIYSLMVNASTSVMNSVNPFSLAWDSFAAIAKMDPLISDLLEDEKCITFAADCQNLQIIARDLLSQDLNMLYSMNFHMGREEWTREYQQFMKLDMILALKSALTARRLLLSTGWLTPQAQNNMQYETQETAKLLQKAQNAKPVVHTAVKGHDEDLTWIENLGKYRVAYASYLRANKSNFYDDARFQLLDINGDLTPELMVSDGWFHMANVQLFTYFGGKVVKLGYFGSYGEMHYIPEENVIVSIYMHQGICSEGFYEIKEDEVVKISFVQSVERYIEETDSWTTDYYINDEETTKAAHEAEVNRIMAGRKLKSGSYGKSVDITEENIQKMLKNVKDFINLG